MNELGTSAEEALAYVKSVPKAAGATMLGVPFEKLATVRVGFIGVGGRGAGHVRQIASVDGTQVVALYDAVPAACDKNVAAVVEKGRPAPAIESDWRKLCERKDLDLVYISTRWNDHVPQAAYAMECGKHAAVEVPAATTLADCWKLVDTSERTRKHCVMMENCCYGQWELLALNLARKGMLGTLTHAEAAYIHDLREILTNEHGEGLWRRDPHIKANGNFYPTHGLGPVAWYFNIHRGDRFTRLVSMSSQEAALSEYRDRKFESGNAKRAEKYACGDINSSLMQTAAGRTILLQHDVVSPRPYSRLNLVTGTKGAFTGFPSRVFFDGDGHDWKTIEGTEPASVEFQTKHNHPLWTKFGELALSQGGHGGMDFLMNYRLMDLMHRGLPPDMDAYDAAAWSAPGPLSEISVRWGNLPLPFPDFTRGQWEKNNAPKAGEA